MTTTKAVLFDFGGTLFDYATTAPGERACLLELARQAGIEADDEAVHRAYRTALKAVFYRYLPQPFYFHRDLFEDALQETAARFDTRFTAAQLADYRVRLWQRRAREFRLRPGVRDTLAALRGRGLHVGIVSNADNDHFAHLMHLSGLDACVDAALTSEDARSCKPDQAIFSLAMDRAGCAPDQTWFVGDSLQQDVAGANRAGMHAVLIWSQPHVPPPDADDTPKRVIHAIPELLEIV